MRRLLFFLAMTGVMLEGNDRERRNQDLPNGRIDGFGNQLAQRLGVETRAFKCFASAFAMLVRFVLIPDPPDRKTLIQAGFLIRSLGLTQACCGS